MPFSESTTPAITPSGRSRVKDTGTPLGGVRQGSFGVKNLSERNIAGKSQLAKMTPPAKAFKLPSVKPSGGFKPMGMKAMSFK